MLTEQILAFSLLLIISVVASKFFLKYGIPSLILFLGLGIFVGARSVGGMGLMNFSMAPIIGNIALVAILFSGGLETDWKALKPVVLSGISLATLGVTLTAALIAVFCHFALGLTPVEGLLIGAIVSSTDVAAVFGMLRPRGTKLKNNLGELLEFESGFNDPTAVILTVAVVQFMSNEVTSMPEMVLNFLLQMIVGGGFGFLMGKLIRIILNKLSLESEGLYPVLTLALAFFTYAVGTLLHGSGFLAVYIAAITLGQESFIKKRTIRLFSDGLAWLVQIMMFIALGLLLSLDQLKDVWIPGTALSLFLVLVARPAAVWIGLAGSKFSVKEKHLVSWIGLRGAVPIILATYPMAAGLKIAPYAFHLVFYVVVVSVLLQGTLIDTFAHRLGLAEKALKPNMNDMSIETARDHLNEVRVRAGSIAVGKTLVELNLPKEILVVLIQRGKETIVPRGNTLIEAKDVLVIMARGDDLTLVEKLAAN